MSSFAISSARNGAAPSYGQNVRRAFRDLIAALVAVPSSGQRSGVRDQLEILRVANRYEELSPNLAAELRSVACRD
jgi:hypothetical protein